MSEKKNYRVAWTNMRTFSNGFMPGLFTRDEACKIADEINSRDDTKTFVHFAEPAPECEVEVVE